MTQNSHIEKVLSRSPRAVFLFALIVFIVPFKARAVDDLITLEAFVQLHIMTSNKEKEARTRLASLGGIQVVTTQEASGFKEKVETMQERVKVAQSWILLATSLSDLGMQIFDVEKDVRTFVTDFAPLAQKSPFGPILYANAVYRIEELTKKALAKMASLEMTNLDLLRATMKQRLNMVYYVKGILSQIQGIIRDTLFHCRYLTGKGHVVYNIREIINSEAGKAAMKAAVQFWISR